MPKKKVISLPNTNFTIYDYANASKPRGQKKANITNISDKEIVDFFVYDEEHADSTKSTNDVCENHLETPDSLSTTGKVYPEIIWYQISRFIIPESVGTFARINKTTYALTKQESFWRGLYNRHCKNNLFLPNDLCIENSYSYCLRARVIRGLYYTYDYFMSKVLTASKIHSPHDLIKWRCVNVWYKTCLGMIYFKFKNIQGYERNRKHVDMIEELARVDANPHEDTKVFRIKCDNISYIPPLMGLTLTSVGMQLASDLKYRHLTMGFHSKHYASKTSPEYSLTFDSVCSIEIFDWWHPKFPYELKIPPPTRDEDSMSMLEQDFFSLPYGDS